MVVKLYGHLASPPVRAVFFVLKNLDIPMEYVNLDITKGELKSEEYMKINPRGTMPAIDDDGFFLTDSHAINIYLTTKYPGGEKFYPKDPAKRAIVDERLFFETGELFTILRDVNRKLFVGGASSVDDNIEETFESRYASLEIYLKTNKYMAGDSVTIADFSVVPTLTALNMYVPVKKDKFPSVTAYMDRAVTLPKYKEINEAGMTLFDGFVKSKNISLPLVK